MLANRQPELRGTNVDRFVIPNLCKGQLKLLGDYRLLTEILVLLIRQYRPQPRSKARPPCLRTSIGVMPPNPCLALAEE